MYDRRNEGMAVGDIPVGDRPRERLLGLSGTDLSDRDLWSVLLGTGSRQRDVLALAGDIRDLMDTSDGRPDRDALFALPGLGRVKAARILAVLELARRLHAPAGSAIRGPEDVWRTVRHYADRPQECFLALALNGAHEVMDKTLVSMGLVNRTLVHPREVFAPALAARAAAVVVAHNHPSGRLEASNEDHEVTRRLKEAGEILGIPLLDHVLFTGKGYLSLTD